MSDVFISYVQENGSVAQEIAQGLEAAGYTTWYYERDGLLGQSYLLQASHAIADAQVVLLLVSPESKDSWQVDREVDHAHQLGKRFIPLLLAMTHRQFRENQLKWSMAVGTAVGTEIPLGGVSTIMPRLLASLAGMGIQPDIGPAPQIPQVSVVTPIVKESWQLGTTHRIAWGVSAGPGMLPIAVRITLYRDAQRLQDIAAREAMDSATGTHDWTVPEWLPPAENYRIRIRARDRADHVGESFVPIALAAAASISAGTAPTGSGTLEAQAGADAAPRQLPGPDSRLVEDDSAMATTSAAHQPRWPSARVAPGLGPARIVAGIVILVVVGWLGIQGGRPSEPAPSTLAPAAAPTQSRTAGVVYSGRVTDGESGRGLADLYVLLLKPGSTRQQWMEAPGMVNDVVAASGTTDRDGAYRTTPGLERGRTYTRLVRTPPGYPDVEDQVVLAPDAPDVVAAANIVVHRTPSPTSTAVTSSLLPFPPLVAPSPTSIFDALFGSLFSCAQPAPVARPLELGQPASGMLSGTDTQHTWTVTLDRPGDLRITLSNLAEDYDLNVHTPAGRCEPSSKPRREDDVVELPGAGSGQYRIVVKAFGQTSPEPYLLTASQSVSP